MRAYTQASRRRIDAKIAARRLAMAQEGKAECYDWDDDYERISTLLSRAECVCVVNSAQSLEARFIAALIYLAYTVDRKRGMCVVLSRLHITATSCRFDDDENDLEEAKHGSGHHIKPLSSFQSSRRDRSDYKDEQTTLTDALEILIKKHVMPFLAARGSDDPFVLAFDSLQVQTTLQDARPHLERVFNKYAGDFKKLQEQNERTDSVHEVDLGDGFGRGITLDGIKKVIQDCGLTALFLLDEYAADRLDKNVLDAFLAVQNDPPVHIELEELTFIEFIESYARVAATMLDSTDLQRKIMLAIDRLCTFSLNL